MRRILYILYICSLLVSCQGVEDSGNTFTPEGKRAVSFVLHGMIGEPLLESSKPATRMGNASGEEVDDFTLKPYQTQNLPDGSTLWILAKEEKPDGTVGDEVVQSYVIHNVAGGQQMLYPCEVDEEGNVVKETSLPMFLNIGSTYLFRAVSPARAFVEGTDHALYVNNKEYVIATDERYEQTSPVEKQIDDVSDDGNVVQIVEINPLINQTSQLEFTIYADESDPNIHSLEVLPQGIEISGIQVQYAADNAPGATPWNWTLGDTLRAFVGQDEEKILIRKDTQYSDSFIEKRENGDLYIHCPILPTDAFSNSIIVLFNLEVNGNPTQYEMMLNQKIFRSAYTYHYRGKVELEDGVTVITWQYVNWENDVPIIPRTND